MASYLEKIMREPKNPYLPADGSLAALRAADMAGYRPNEAILPNMNPMHGYTSRRMDGYRPNTLDSGVPKGRQPDKDYSGYGKSLEEALPYGYEFEDADNAVVGVGFDNPNATRIEQLRGEIASLEKQIKDYDAEEEMGRYKFQYDADPSTYTSLMQNRRTAAQTEAIRKATEEATKQSNAQNQWNSLGDKLEVAQWALHSAQNKFVESERNQNVAGMRDARDEIERYTKSVKTLEAQRDQIRNKFMKDLELDTAEVELDKDAMKDYDARIGENVELESISRDLVKLDNVLNTERQKNYSQEEINEARDTADREIPRLREMVSKSKVSPTKKAELEEKLNALDVKANDWRLKGKNKPTRRLTPEEEKANAEKAVFKDDGTVKNPAYLAENIGAKTLRAYQQKYGWDLTDGINRADSDGNK